MTIAILTRRSWETKMPRPFNRAGSKAEAVEMIEMLARARSTTRVGWKREARALDMRNLDTDEPVMVIASLEGIIDVYAYTDLT